MTPSPRDAAKFAVVVVVAACATTVDNADPVPPVDATAWTTIAAGDAAPSAATTVPVPSPATVASTTSSSSPLAPPTIPSGATTTIPPELNPCPPRGRSHFVVRPPVAWSIPDIPSDWRLQSIGTSVQGRDILAAIRPAVADAQHKVMVIGSIHGNEVTNVPILRNMVNAEIPDDVELWLIPDANPDGTAIGTRCNANGVDLNRNFDWNWNPAEGGPAPMSEPETRALADLVIDEWPDLVVWVHQPLRYVAAIGPTDPVHARAWARASDLPFRDDISQRGGGESWTAFVAGRPSVLLEVQFRDLSDRLVDLHVDGLSAALASFP